jgi:hypothetical protein
VQPLRRILTEKDSSSVQKWNVAGDEEEERQNREGLAPDQIPFLAQSEQVVENLCTKSRVNAGYGARGRLTNIEAAATARMAGSDRLRCYTKRVG